MDHTELLQKYNEAIEEIERLRKIIRENGISITSNHEADPTIVQAECSILPKINKYSSVDEKIKLFRSLFSGRDDVYAKRWHSVSTGKSGYQPVCGNEWDDLLCNKKEYKCSNCPNRKLLPIDRNAIFAHLSGKDPFARDVIGIYPMLEDETCRFLAVDFDDGQFKEEARAFKASCTEYGIPSYIERSRSGSGVHVWIFFTVPVCAATARKLGSGLLTHAMKQNSHISFTSYDRLFPNQDAMPDGGFGNLIALPLQGLARRNGNSAFVDDRFIPFEDQWAFLSTVKRITPDEVSLSIEKICPRGELGELLADTNDNEKAHEKPWESKKEHHLKKSDFPDIIKIVRANMLYIPKEGVSHRAIDRLRRLAAFKNPDFYKAQAMRLPIFNKPRVICTADEIDDYICLPRGCEADLLKTFDTISVSYVLEDKTNAGKAINVSFNGELRYEQIPAASALLEHDKGVLAATTAFGKTVIGAYLISQRKVNTLVLVHTASLLDQWRQALERFLIIDEKAPPVETKRGRPKKWSAVGSIGSGRCQPSGIIDVAIMQSLTDGENVKELVRDYGMIIIDECHHVPAVNFERIMKYSNARYVYGLSATPSRQDGHHPLLFMHCGPVRYIVDAKTQAEKRGFEHTVIPRFTPFRSVDSKEKSISQIYSEIIQSDIRNQTIIDDVLLTLEQKRTPIILTERREHVEILAEKLSQKCKSIVKLTGTMTIKEKREVMEKLSSISDDEIFAIIATGKYVGEGFDYPRLDTLFLTMPIAWKGKVAQYAGRLHRNYEGKSEVQIFDYVDIHVPVLERMYQKRLKSYLSIGYRTRSLETNIERSSILFDGKSFLPVYYNDLESACHEIIIVSPFMRKNRLSQMIGKLQALAYNGVSVTVVTRPIEDFKSNDHDAVRENLTILNDAGIHIIFKSGFHQKFTSIDSKTVWYGSVNFLSFGTNEESIMRIESKDIAEQLLDSIEI